MKTIILLLAALLFTIAMAFTCCTPNNNRTEPPKDEYYEYRGGLWGDVEYKIQEKTIDSCQYLVVFGINSKNIIHKANCNNAFHNKN